VICPEYPMPSQPVSDTLASDRVPTSAKPVRSSWGGAPQASRTRTARVFGVPVHRGFILLASIALLAALTGCAASREQEATQQATAVAYAQATNTAIAAPTLAAQHRAEAVASATSVQATAQAEASRAAVAQATQQALVIDARVQAAVAATQAVIPTATSIPPTQTPVPAPQAPAVIVVAQPTPAPVYVPVPVPAPVYVQAEAPFWTVQVAASSSQPAAEDMATRLRSRGVAGATLFSSYYSSLTPGYWVTFSGKFDDRATAEHYLERVRGTGFSTAFVREVRR
jgi:SPOR domain